MCTSLKTVLFHVVVGAVRARAGVPVGSMTTGGGQPRERQPWDGGERPAVANNHEMGDGGKRVNDR